MGFTHVFRAASCGALTGALLFASASLATADQTRDMQWALDALNAESVWRLSKGSGVTVAVIDDGVNASHVDLQGNVLEGKDFMDGGSASPDPGDSHGTGMASIIAAHGHGDGDGIIGLAPEAKILPVRDFGTDGPGISVSIRYAVDQGASVINVSQCFDSSSQEELDKASSAVAYALKHDVLVVGGAGNDGNSAKCYPAAADGALGVGAVSNDGQIWERSNYGSHVSLVAPGTHIVSAGGAGNEYRGGTGTSNATAYVSAAAALIRSKFPDLSAGQVANRLVKTAALPDSEKRLALPDEHYGYGIIQPLAALEEEIPADSKYGPLTVPESLQQSAAPAAGASGEEQEKADKKAMLIWAIIGLAAIAFIVLIVFLIARMSRRNRSNGGEPGGQPLGGQQYVAPQQNPYQQPVQPQQNPYYQQPPTPPQGQWPPQQ